MKKLSFLLCSALVAGGILWGCSTDYDPQISTESKLLSLKQQILSCGRQYGLENLNINDDVLRSHLDITKEEIEQEVFLIASSMGYVDSANKTSIRKAPKRIIGENENNGEVVVYVSGTENVVQDVDSLRFSFTLNYQYDSYGILLLTTGSPSSVTSIYKCGNPNCTIKHEKSGSTKTGSCTIMSSNQTVSGSFGPVGQRAHLSIPYRVDFSYTDSIPRSQIIAGNLEVEPITEQR